MKEKLRFLGLDVHAETIAVAVAEPEGEVRNLGTIPNRAESIRKMIKKLGSAEKLRACYEAGPTGYVVYWQLAHNPNHERPGRIFAGTGCGSRTYTSAAERWAEQRRLVMLVIAAYGAVQTLEPVIAFNPDPAAPEALSPAKLATRANRMYNTGRLQQALGESQADDLLRSIERTKQAAQDAAENAARQSDAATAKAAQRTAAVRRNQTIATTAAGGIGAGTAWAWLKHLLGE